MNYLTTLEDLRREQRGSLLLKESADSFEDTFASIAHAYLQEKAIKLIPYLVGFEVVDKNDESTKAIGLFAFKLGKRYLYAPVFFLNGQIKPLELLYVKDEDLMVPLDERWVGHLLKQVPVELGEPSNDTKERQMSYPNLEVFATPPRTGRYLSASLRDSKIPDWLTEFGPSAQSSLLKAMKKDASFARAMSQYTDLDKILNVCRRGVLQVEKRATDKVTAKLTSVAVPEDLNDPEVFRALPAEDKKVLSQGKPVVRDLRPKEQVSSVYSAQYMTRYSNPVKSGVYKTVDGDGCLTECLVLLAPKSLRRMYASDGATVLELATNKWCVSPVEKIWVLQSSIVDDWTPFFEKTEEADSADIGDTVVFLNEKLYSSAPARVAAKVRASDGLQSYRLVPEEYGFPRRREFDQSQKQRLKQDEGQFSLENPGDVYFPYGLSASRAGVSSSETSTDASAPKAILSPVWEGNLQHLGQDMVVPGNYRLYKLKTPSSAADKLVLGTDSDVQYMLRRNRIKELLIWSDKGDHSISLDRMPASTFGKKAAIKYLMNCLGVEGGAALGLLEDACDLEKTAGRGTPMKALIKLAFGYPGPMEGAMIPDPTFTADPGAAQNMQQFEEQLIPLGEQEYQQLPSMDSSDSNIYHGPPGIEESSMDTELAMQAAGTGQQQVFDHAVLGTLAKTTQTSDLIQGYIPELQTALDRLGRILFLLWSKPEAFKDLYGVAQLAEGEDKIRNVFRSLGEVLLDLRAKESNRLVNI